MRAPVKIVYVGITKKPHPDRRKRLPKVLWLPVARGKYLACFGYLVRALGHLLVGYTQGWFWVSASAWVREWVAPGVAR